MDEALLIASPEQTIKIIYFSESHNASLSNTSRSVMLISSKNMVNYGFVCIFLCGLNSTMLHCAYHVFWAFEMCWWLREADSPPLGILPFDILYKNWLGKNLQLSLKIRVRSRARGVDRTISGFRRKVSLFIRAIYSVKIIAVRHQESWFLRGDSPPPKPGVHM